jgi:hypothetical protein
MDFQNCKLTRTSRGESFTSADLTTNVKAEWLALLLHIREFLGSNPGPETAILSEVFVVFLSPSRQMPVP